MERRVADLEGTPEPVDVPRLAAIAAHVCQHWGITKNDLRSRRRSARLVWARQTFCLLGRDMTPASHTQLGRYLGNRDHATVMHSCKVGPTRPEVVRAANAVRVVLRSGAAE